MSSVQIGRAWSTSHTHMAMNIIPLPAVSQEVSCKLSLPHACWKSSFFTMLWRFYAQNCSPLLLFNWTDVVEKLYLPFELQIWISPSPHQAWEEESLGNNCAEDEGSLIACRFWCLQCQCYLSHAEKQYWLSSFLGVTNENYPCTNLWLAATADSKHTSVLCNTQSTTLQRTRGRGKWEWSSSKSIIQITFTWTILEGI